MLPGIVYVAIRELFPQQNVLPINSFPDAVRQQQPQLGFQPHIEFVNGDRRVLLGPNVIALTFSGIYPGWTAVAKQMEALVNALTEAKLELSITRFGLRHVDFFKGEFAPHFRLSVSIDEEAIDPPGMACVLSLKRDQFNCRVQIHTGVTQSQDKISGCVLDSDVSTDNPELNKLDNCLSWYREAHILQKKIFFGLIKKEKLKEFNPQYA